MGVQIPSIHRQEKKGEREVVCCQVSAQSSTPKSTKASSLLEAASINILGSEALLFRQKFFQEWESLSQVLLNNPPTMQIAPPPTFISSQHILPLPNQFTRKLQTQFPTPVFSGCTALGSNFTFPSSSAKQVLQGCPGELQLQVQEMR